MSTRTMVFLLLSSLILTALWVGYSSAAPKDRCRENGIVVRNATMLDLWHKKAGGHCTIWIHEHLFTIKLGDTIGIFSDMTCATNYCSSNPTYRDYKATDENGDCRVRILPDCRLSDM